ncbi:fused MFS/spermidine synthase [uncultured Paludibaculum sp.]|uniref:fused MFS/spermidine synthase n=1 Tax=uncultured Paludibaculum sp. TaxID=1765020 RepID=UPI002AAADD46|nr:fused MFS/spermidine synthase [uncultured Paludibaculum sp.]
MLFYAVTIFLSAFLLFQVQPIIAKMILPWFGGTAAVWATCLLFFQAALLLGYFYSHGIVKRLKPKQQWMLHSALLLLCLLLLPITPNASWKPLTPDAPIFRILGLLAATIGLPYFLLSTTGPLIQAWYVQSNPGAIPYRLFALSNLASMLALLSYPPLIEPNLTLHHQAYVWSGGFALFTVLCIFTGWRSYRTAVVAEASAAPEDPAPQPPTRSLYLMAIGLSAVPSMLLLSLTSHMSMDLAPIPFLWILPLALYLLTFILCFDAEGWYRRVWFLAALPFAIAAIGWLMRLDPSERPDVRLCITEYAFAFFIVCMCCHGELARLKPHPKFLTGYFLMVSIGGALGGVFVALIAPSVFNANYELPLSLCCCVAMACLVLFRDNGWPFRKDLLGWPAIALFTLSALLIGALAREMREMVSDSILVARNFYGELRVKQYDGIYDWDGHRSLVHGSINHGEEYTHPARRKEIATYYCPDTALGLVMGTRSIGQIQRVAVIGLGTGTIAAYSRMGDLYRFYEINPLVRKISNEQFWYLSTAEGLVEIAMGDARLSLEREPVQNFDTIAVDAFSSDSIPVHLLTREAMLLYFHHLKPDGVLAVHISNRYIDLKPVLERAAQSIGKSALIVETDDDEEGKCYGTTWVLITGNKDLLERPEFKKAGTPPTPAPWLPVWTDDYSNIYKVLK